MPHPMGEIREALKQLQKTATEARLPSDKKTHIDCFLPLFNQFYKDFNSAQERTNQQFYFAVMYGLIRIHGEHIKSKLVAYQSHVGYFRSFVETDASQIYHQSLLAFLDKYEEDFQLYRRSVDAAQYIFYTEAPKGTTYESTFHEGFSFGTLMAHEKDEVRSSAQPTSFAQLAKRIYALNFFEMYEKELDEVSSKNTQAAIAINGAAILFAPLAVPALTLAATGVAYYKGHVGPSNHPMKEALSGSVIRNYVLNSWRTQIKGILSYPSKAEELLKKLEGGALSKLKLL